MLRATSRTHVLTRSTWRSSGGCPNRRPGRGERVCPDGTAGTRPGELFRSHVRTSLAVASYAVLAGRTMSGGCLGRAAPTAGVSAAACRRRWAGTRTRNAEIIIPPEREGWNRHVSHPMTRGATCRGFGSCAHPLARATLERHDRIGRIHATPTNAGSNSRRNEQSKDLLRRSQELADRVCQKAYGQRRPKLTLIRGGLFATDVAKPKATS
jgi:hypothetical protein